MKKTMLTIILLSFTASGLFSQVLKKEIIRLSDAPEKNELKNSSKDTLSYSTALKTWTSINDINRWIATHFHYDMSRAISLGSKRNSGPKIDIYSPAEMFTVKSGICVDLSRFAFETAKIISPEIKLKYLMIDFEPIEIQGSVIRKHWVVAFQKNGKFFITADSKVPGKISGPFETIDEYILEYEKFRGRKIESFKLLDDYKKKQKQKLVRNKQKNKKANQKVNG